jgi:hypothetical protein
MPAARRSRAPRFVLAPVPMATPDGKIVPGLGGGAVF